MKNTPNLPLNLLCKENRLIPLLVITVWLGGCNMVETEPAPQPQITSVEYIDGLLFVNKSDFQIQTSEPATFSSTDPKIQISSTGLVKRLTSAEVVAIDVAWTNQPGKSTKIYALGATDDSFDEPYASFHGRLATDPNAAYQQGWKTLQELSSLEGNYAIILRHADANVGRDFSRTTGPANWWTSCDSTQARQLNTQGKQRSVELGKVFKDLNLPITRVTSSEFCRSTLTAQLINSGPTIITDGRLNHSSYNLYGNIFNGIIKIVKEQPVDQKITLIVTHHAGNEGNYATFPSVSPFTWTGGFFIKVSPDKSITYAGAASWGMFKYWRDKKRISN